MEGWPGYTLEAVGDGETLVRHDVQLAGATGSRARDAGAEAIVALSGADGDPRRARYAPSSSVALVDGTVEDRSTRRLTSR